MGAKSNERSGANRAQSSVVGLVLLFGFILFVSFAVVVAGSAVVEQTRESTSVQGATVSMTELESAVADLSGPSASSRTVSFAGVAGQTGDVSVERTGNLTVVVRDTQSGDDLLNETYRMGRVVVERGEYRLAYQGGGVWRSTDGSNNSALVSGPDLTYRYQGQTPTLSVPVISVAGSADGQSVTLSQPEPTETRFPRSATATNPLDESTEVTVRVDSAYYKAWGQYFESETEAQVDYEHGNGTVAFRMDGPVPEEPRGWLPGALVSLQGRSLTLSNHATIRSYDSSGTAPFATRDHGDVYVRASASIKNQAVIGGDLIVRDYAIFYSPKRVAGAAIVGGDPTDYQSTVVNNHVRFEDDFSTEDDLEVGGSDGVTAYFAEDVTVGGDLEKATSMHVAGDLHVGGDVPADPKNVTVEGDLIAGGTVPSNWNGTATVEGETVQNGSPAAPETPTFPSMPDAGTIIAENETEIGNNQDSDSDLMDVENNWAGKCSTTCDLDAGNYTITDGLRLGDGEKLILNATEGPIRLYVEKSPSGFGVKLNNANLTVRGDHPVRLYTDGFLYVTGTDATIVTRPDPRRAPLFTAYVHPSESITLNSGTPEITGLYYGHGSSQSATVDTFTNGAIVHGALVADTSGLDSEATINFDEALVGGVPEGPAPGDTVRFVHVSNRTIRAGA